MQVIDMEPMSTDSEYVQEDGTINPFRQDFYNMGHRLGTNVIVMFDTFDSQKMDYLIIVDTKTGERKRITF
jgi:hypothetical protein